MARYEIVGRHDCPWYAKAEMMADYLQHQFSNIEFHKTIKDEFQWSEFVLKMKEAHGWDMKTSPVIWQVLVEPYGKAKLIGGINEFCEYVELNFGYISNVNTHGMNIRMNCNKKAFLGRCHANKLLCNVSLINGSTKLLECVLSQLLSPSFAASGSASIVFNVSIYNENYTRRELEELCMEITEMCSPNLLRVNPAASSKEAMYKCDLLIVLDDLTRRVEESTDDWFNRVEWKMLKYAQEANDFVNYNSKILIGGHGCSTFSAEIIRHVVSRRKVRPGNIVSVGQHTVTQAKNEIARKAKLVPGCIRRLFVYGWPGSVGGYTEVRDAIYKDGAENDQCEYPLSQVPLNPPEALQEFFAWDFLLAQKRRIENIEVPPPSDMSQAEAVVNTVRLWLTSGSDCIPAYLDDQICCPGLASDDDRKGKNCDKVLPVICVGIKCLTKLLNLPRGTFMVQPAVCYKGKWIPAGIISPRTFPRIWDEIKKLWDERQKLIYKEARFAGVMSNYEVYMSRLKQKILDARKNTSDPVEDAGETEENAGQDV